MTWREYVLISEGYNKRRIHEFEHTRAFCYYTVAVHRDPNKAFPTMQQFWPLPTDSDADPDENIEEKRLQHILNKYKEGKYGRPS